jgi:hypothetical protein
MPLHANYQANLDEAKDFEDFVFDTLLYERKFVCGGYKSRHYQTLHGESLTGVEVKLDRKFRSTGNLWIETQERPSVAHEYAPAGIYHKAGPWLIVIGDYSTLWAIASQSLRLIHEANVCREVENETKTGRGFLLPSCKADRHAAFKWEA